MDKPTDGDGRREKRRRAILAAARALFLEKGYSRTTIGDIVAESGGSRSTLMELFGGKEGLLVAVLIEASRVVETTFSALAGSVAPPEVALRDFAHQFAHAVLQPETMAMLSMLAAEGGRFPEIAAEFFRLGPDVVVAMLSDYFRRNVAAGYLRPMDPDATARSFLGMVLGGAEVRILAGASVAEQRAEALARIDAAVGIFLRGVSREASSVLPR